MRTRLNEMIAGVILIIALISAAVGYAEGQKNPQPAATATAQVAR